MKLGKLSARSYTPSGLSKAQYESVRQADKQKKDANYKRNVAKAGVFQNYTEFYKKRGTDMSQSWAKSVTLGHTMAKTAYDWSGKTTVAKTTAAVKPKAAAGKKKFTFGKK